MRERKSGKLNLQQQSQESDHNTHSSPFKLAKLLDPDASWDKDQICDVLHWIRFVVLSTAIIYTYYAIVLKIDEEDFGGHGSLLQEGLFASICLFLLSWILVYSLAHF